MTELHIRVFCTGRGHHPRVSLGRLTGPLAKPPGADQPEGLARYGQRAKTSQRLADTTGARKMKELLPEVEIDDAGVTQWKCPRCNRNPQLKPDKALDLWAGLVRNGTTELDISALPF